jgi:hypothetical protein
VQRGYRDSLLMFQLAGLHELLCNNCGLEFKGFDPLRKIQRKPSRQRESNKNHRRFARFQVHLPATIALVERHALTWDISYSKAAQGHCETISEAGMALSFVGSRLAENQFRQPGCPLYATVTLPGSVIAAVLSTVTCHRGVNGQAKWFIGAKIMQMSDADAAALAAYLAKRAKTEPVLAPR